MTTMRAKSTIGSDVRAASNDNSRSVRLLFYSSGHQRFLAWEQCLIAGDICVMANGTDIVRCWKIYVHTDIVRCWNIYVQWHCHCAPLKHYVQWHWHCALLKHLCSHWHCALLKHLCSHWHCALLKHVQWCWHCAPLKHFGTDIVCCRNVYGQRMINSLHLLVIWFIPGLFGCGSFCFVYLVWFVFVFWACSCTYIV